MDIYRKTHSARGLGTTHSSRHPLGVLEHILGDKGLGLITLNTTKVMELPQPYLVLEGAQKGTASLASRMAHKRRSLSSSQDPCSIYTQEK